jgi:ABC-2 type transport system permease protein
MKKIAIVMHYELGRTLRRGSFLFVAFGIPLIAVVIFGVIALTQDRDSDSTASGNAPAFEFAAEGYVDHSGLVQALPPDIPANHLIPYTTEKEARQALASGEITAFYVVPADYVEVGAIDYVYPNSASLLDDRQKWVMRWTLLFNLLDGDLERAQTVWNPMVIFARQSDFVAQPTSTGVGCAPGMPCAPEAFNQFFPALMVVLFYLAFLMSGDLLFKSVSGEKENRTIEVLILSLTPRQMLVGKIVGLGTAGLLQLAAWVGAVIAIVSFGGQTLGLPTDFALPPSVPVWSLVFFLLGFAIYASLMAGVGVLVPNIKEAGQATIVAIFPLLVGYLVGFISSIAEVPHALTPTILSLFPLTAPVLMIMRLTVGNVPWWQPWLAAVLMVGSAYFVIRAVAAMFRAQNLLSGQPFSVKRYFLALVGRE